MIFIGGLMENNAICFDFDEDKFTLLKDACISSKGDAENSNTLKFL